MIRVKQYTLGPMENNTYLLVDEPSRECAVIDPSFDSQPLWNEILEQRWNVRWVLNTHGHFDHVVENQFFVMKSCAPLAIHEEDVNLMRMAQQQAAMYGMDIPPMVEPTFLLKAGQKVPLGESLLTVEHTPGHSPGSVVFLGQDFVIGGDVLFAGSIGRTDLPGGSHSQLLDSIERHLLCLPDEMSVYPGHGIATTIGNERQHNPFLSRRAF